jgi:hypothetical protein
MGMSGRALPGTRSPMSPLTSPREAMCAHTIIVYEELLFSQSTAFTTAA